MLPGSKLDFTPRPSPSKKPQLRPAYSTSPTKKQRPGPGLGWHGQSVGLSLLMACSFMLFVGSRWMHGEPHSQQATAGHGTTATHQGTAAYDGSWRKHVRRMFLATTHQTQQSLIHHAGSSDDTGDDTSTSTSTASTHQIRFHTGRGDSGQDEGDGGGYSWSNGHAGDVEVWARGLPGESGEAGRSAVRERIPEGVRANLTQLCGRCLYRTLTAYTRVRGQQGAVFVETGDIPAMWTRDSAVQAGSYIPRIPARPFIRGVVEGALRALAYFILQDPWANAYKPEWQRVQRMTKEERQLGRGGWVWTRNFELDSAGYFFNFINNYYRSPGIWGAAVLLRDPLMHDAVLAMLRVLETEQDHEKRSPYRYSELARDGLGPPCAVTGMVWSAFRPSDDMNKFSYSIPSNMYVAGALERLASINKDVWRDPIIANLTNRLARDMRAGIERWGVVDVPGQQAEGAGEKMYAYEVDGLGNALADFDDPNLPSLLAMPLLGYKHYDQQTYLTTRARILSKANSHYFTGTQLKGMGSPHTPHNYIWPLAHIVQALTSEDPSEQAALLQDLLKMSLQNGLVHESVNVHEPHQFTRPEFGWANAMTVVAVEQLLGVDCDAAAEELRMQDISAREDPSARLGANGGQDRAYYYEQLSAQVNHKTTTQREQQGQ